jgi:transcriptional regulator with XRE-family HTH domain
MIDRITMLIKAKNLSAAQFADEIGVQRSSISHLMSGRNKPSLDLIQKTLQRFPEVSSEWLLFGKGEMVRELNLFDAQARTASNVSSITEEIELNPGFSQKQENTKQAKPMAEKEFLQDSQDVKPVHEEIANEHIAVKTPEIQMEQQETLPKVEFKPETRNETSQKTRLKNAKIDQVIVLFDDHTFTAYSTGN